MSDPVLVTPPQSFIPVPAARAVIGSDVARDQVLLGCLDAVIGRLDGWRGELGRCLGAQVWAMDLPTWAIDLPLGDIIAIESVGYRDPTGIDRTVGTGDYRLDGTVVRFRAGLSYPAVDVDHPEPIRVTWRAGFAVLPADLRMAIIRAAGAMLGWSDRDAALKSETVPGVRTWAAFDDAEMVGRAPDAEAVFNRYRVPRP